MSRRIQPPVLTPDFQVPYEERSYAMDFRQKYTFVDPQPLEGTQSFRARQTASGREVMVHLLTGGKTQENEALMARLRKIPPRLMAKLVEVGEYEGTRFVVTIAPPYQA